MSNTPATDQIQHLANTLHDVVELFNPRLWPSLVLAITLEAATMDPDWATATAQKMRESQIETEGEVKGVVAAAVISSFAQRLIDSKEAS